jgi:hypothetical protein
MPVMQGAKTMFFIPMYMLAADRTHTRWGGTTAGGIMGFIAFLNGDSRYGIFEVLKHLVPGMVIDLVWPLVRRLPLRMWILVLVGLLAAAVRTSTQFAMILCLGSDNEALFVIALPKLIMNGIAGAMSALVSYPVLKHLGSRAMAERSGRLAPCPSVAGQGGAQGSACGGAREESPDRSAVGSAASAEVSHAAMPADTPAAPGI